MAYSTITLATKRRMLPTEAEAIICGRFAVHAPDGSPIDTHDATYWYAVTHIATGYQVGTVEGRGPAIVRARALDAALGENDITEADFSGEWSDRYRTFVARVKEIVR